MTLETQQPVTEPTEDPEAEQERNFKALRHQRDEAQKTVEELMGPAVDGLLLRAGFDPASGQGKALAKAIKAGEIKPEGEEAGTIPDPADVAAFAAAEFDWQPELRFYSGMEAVQLEGSARLDALDQASTSDAPDSLGDEYGNKIAAARERGDFGEASRLQLEYERRTRGRAGAR